MSDIISVSYSKLLLMHLQQLWDHSTGKLVRRMRSHYSRVGCMSWNPQSSGTLSSGSQMGDIHHYDVRVPQFHTHSMNRSHLLDVCGLEWSHNGRLLASGGNDNIVNVWENDSRTTPLHSLREHSAAVKVSKTIVPLIIHLLLV